MEPRNSYKYCGVPLCTNTSIKTPKKLFLRIPTDITRRKSWMKAARRRDDYSLKSNNVYYCEDHFEVESCIVNYHQIKLMGGNVLVSKTAMPTKFACQADRLRTCRETRHLPLKRRRLELVESAQSQYLELESDLPIHEDSPAAKLICEDRFVDGECQATVQVKATRVIEETMVSVDESKFGTFTDPKTGKTEDVIKYTLKNGKGVIVEILNYGATIAAVRYPDKDGVIADVVLGYDTFEGYLTGNNPYFGAVVGRVANRVGGAHFFLDGREYNVTANKGINQLHGGLRGFDKVIWNSFIQGTKVVFTYLSVDGEEGYPGDLLVTATYSLTENGDLILKMEASTTKPTPINLTNHAYFNLAGDGSGSTGLYDHIISVNADRYTVTDKDSIPIGKLAPVEGTLWDLRIPRRMGDAVPFVPGGGYDQNLCVTRSQGQGLAFVARVVHPSSSRSMEVYSNQPGVQLYTSNYFPKDTRKNAPDSLSEVEEPLIGRGGKNYYQHGAFCLETQNYPDAVNHINFPNSILRPGEKYEHLVVYKFRVFTESA